MQCSERCCHSPRPRKQGTYAPRAACVRATKCVHCRRELLLVGLVGLMGVVEVVGVVGVVGLMGLMGLMSLVGLVGLMGVVGLVGVPRLLQLEL